MVALPYMAVSLLTILCIPGIVHDNKETLDGLKAIKQKNDETSKVKTRVDIPSVVSGFKRLAV